MNSSASVYSSIRLQMKAVYRVNAIYKNVQLCYMYSSQSGKSNHETRQLKSGFDVCVLSIYRNSIPRTCARY
jgi:hypothetical protein